ncbi:hypothetical protein [Clostridium brassicae]|uniref:HAD family hydrolase n=1 Tax=Clostridium brassicae TaxID=2999072 RepID=A0ABT4DAW7_9CLOT|nr:hypothetical protein [Clostridium brassicae]MCY6958803.1 hypothetical protein [Clostridium brassicae]
MLPQQPCFVFFIESLITQTNTLDPYALKFISTLQKNNCYFLTHNSNTNRETFYNDLVSKNIPCIFNNVVTPNDIPYSYNALSLFKFINISPKRIVVITNVLTDDYCEYQRLGGKLILILNNGTTYDDYLKSHHDPDLVLGNFHNLAIFLNKKRR